MSLTVREFLCLLGAFVVIIAGQEFDLWSDDTLDYFALSMFIVAFGVPLFLKFVAWICFRISDGLDWWIARIERKQRQRQVQATIALLGVQEFLRRKGVTLPEDK